MARNNIKKKSKKKSMKLEQQQKKNTKKPRTLWVSSLRRWEEWETLGPANHKEERDPQNHKWTGKHHNRHQRNTKFYKEIL